MLVGFGDGECVLCIPDLSADSDEVEGVSSKQWGFGDTCTPVLLFGSGGRESGPSLPK